eukprot:ANDGO_03359.mRNA.1 hypothetical protein
MESMHTEDGLSPLAVEILQKLLPRFQRFQDQSRSVMKPFEINYYANALALNFYVVYHGGMADPELVRKTQASEQSLKSFEQILQLCCDELDPMRFSQSEIEDLFEDTGSLETVFSKYDKKLLHYNSEIRQFLKDLRFDYIGEHVDRIRETIRFARTCGALQNMDQSLVNKAQEACLDIMMELM